MAGVIQAFPDIQKQVDAVQKTLTGLKAIEDQLNRPRSVVCTVLNVTDVPLTYGARNLDHGEKLS